MINDIKLAQAEKAAAQAALQQAQAELVHLRAVQQSLSAQLKLAQTEKTRNAIRKQLKANTDALTAATNQQTAAQARLDVAMKATSFAANGLRSAMALLGGPAGMLFLAAGALSMWSSKIDEAKQKSLEPGDKVDQLREKYKSLNQEQKQLELSRLKVFFDKTKESIDWQIVAVKELKAEYEQYKRRAAGALNSIFTSQEGLNEAQNKYLEASDKLKKSQENLAKAEKARSDIESGAIEKTNEATEANKNLSKSWDKVSQSEIDKKLASLSKELDIAQLKAKKNSEAAFVLDGLYSALGDSANEYREDLMALDLGQTNFTKLSNDQAAALQPLIALLKSLSAENEKLNASKKSGRGTTKSYAEEIKELSDKLEVAKLEAQGLTVESELLAITQKMGSKVTAKQTEELRKLIEASQAYKELGSLKSPIEAENDAYKKSKDSLDKLQKLGEIKTQEEYNAKLEQVEKQHQINMAKIKSEAVVSKIDDAVAQIDPVQALKNENDRKLALIQEFEKQKWITEENAIALREAANHQYEQNRINAQWEIWRNQSDANEFLASSLEGLASSATSTISGLMSGTMTATQAMQNFANVILNEAIGSLVQMGMQYVKNAIVAKTTSAATTAAQVLEAQTLALAYEPAAMNASIATQGAAAAIGAEAYATAIKRWV
ncbi:hypothetical protein [Gilliamella sp. Bif1-4]|uniref:hypothetical protein n=1 Tax=Gilliamella sp. Bif1-4 TaxID=3120233 RepID=UPI00080EDCC0|nr:hypothetical protein [Gilliamella apicola]OCG39778.1 hypothetical protein A9G25_10295 [Gilliamella apicola]